jgi:alpha-galactosidase
MTNSLNERSSLAAWVLLVLFAVLVFAAHGEAADSTHEILTPKPGPAPHLNGPKIYGARPGHPFLYRIPCTGERPLRFSAKGLPSSIGLDSNSGIMTGQTPTKTGEYIVTLTVTNAQGSSSRQFKIVVGDTLALTPPMGWNDWYTHYDHITDQLVRQAADAMISSGLADFGYQYIDIDDCWMVKPGAKEPELGGEVPDMKGLADYIHLKGLKAGLYTSPGPQTCAGFEGSYKHEETDARQFAAWGFDLLKYDWCSYEKIAKDASLPELKKPYELMGSILKTFANTGWAKCGTGPLMWEVKPGEPQAISVWKRIRVCQASIASRSKTRNTMPLQDRAVGMTRITSSSDTLATRSMTRIPPS